jgi:ankyrin repeat protein
MNEKDKESRAYPNGEPLAVKRRHGTSLRASANQPELTPARRLMLAAGRGEIDTVRHLLARDQNLIDYVDDNHWQPLHEAVRGGSLETVQFLVDHGADIGWKVTGGRTALAIARESLPDEHEIIKYLEEIGAPDINEDNEVVAE